MPAHSYQRRTLLAALGALAAPLSFAAAADAFASLPRSPRMPVLFVGHGSPMNAITHNEWRTAWQAMGARFGVDLPRPALILCVSAHWLTRGWWVTGAMRPRTVHDFGGFPRELLETQYPAPGAPRFAGELAAWSEAGVRIDGKEWGYDHGAWSVLKPMFPGADIPVVQLSLAWDRPASEHLAMARSLKALRERGVLVVGSGNVVHNLRAVRRDAGAQEVYPWAREFDARIAQQLQARDHDAMAQFERYGQLGALAHPSYDHFLPLLHAAGASSAEDRMTEFAGGFQSASLSMRSVIWS